MKIAIFSDVHGNLTAFEAVLADIKRQEPDQVFFAGDLCWAGARPQACLDLLEAEGIPAVYGNTDSWLSNPPPLPVPTTAEQEKQLQMYNDTHSWLLDQLGQIGAAKLSAYPFHRRVSPSVNPKDDLFIVHANPVDVNQPIFPNEDLQKKIYGEVKQPDDDNDLQHLLQDLDTGVLAFGHVHIPNVRSWSYRGNEITLANISSVSLPLDGDARAKYGLLSWTAENGWNIEHQYVDYDIDKERKVLSEVQPPNWESLSQRLG